jgi:hypothetical protein
MCQQSGDVTVRVDNADCAVDLYVLDNTCDPDAGCLDGDTDTSANSVVTFSCVASETYYLVVEVDEFATTNACVDGDAYQLSFEVGPGLGCAEDCDNGLDDNFNADVDCDDSACSNDPACLPTTDAGAAVVAFLEGPYAGGSMTPAPDGYVPSAQPYSASPWSYAGGEEVDAAFLDSHPDIVDWVLLELRTGDPTSPPMDIVARRAALLLADGTVVDTAGSPPVLFQGVAGGPYYVAIFQRNHVAAMSAGSVDFVSGIGLWDLTNDIAQTYPGDAGANPLKQEQDGRFSLFAADENADGVVQALDFNGFLTATIAGLTGYQVGDFNLDGQVQALDFNLYIANTLRGAETSVPAGAVPTGPELVRVKVQIPR